MDVQQRCGRCKQLKDLAAFSPSYRSKPGTWCRACFADYKSGDRTPPAQHESRECCVCGVQYVPKQIKVANDKGFCSQKCRDLERKESGRGRDQHLLKKYGITAEDYDRLLGQQGGGCALCGVRPEDLRTGRFRTYLHVDHCHDTGTVRGLLCPDHNLLLGRFGDNVEMFRKVVTYLEAGASPSHHQ